MPVYISINVYTTFRIISSNIFIIVLKVYLYSLIDTGQINPQFRKHFEAVAPRGFDNFDILI